MGQSRVNQLLTFLVAIALVVPAFGQNTLTVENSTITNTNVSAQQMTPTQGLVQIYTLFQDQAANTKIPADGNTLISVQYQQNNANVAGTPLLLGNVRLANLMSECNAAIPPCLVLTPSVYSPGAEEANQFLAERSTTKEYCLPGVLSTRDDVRYFRLGNGLVVRLAGKLADVPAEGESCLCGVVGTPPEPVDTITLDVHKVCDKRQRMAKD